MPSTGFDRSTPRQLGSSAIFRFKFKRYRPILLAAATAALLAGCAEKPRPLSDSEQIVGAVLGLLAKSGPVCTDDHTQDHALSVYREMIVAPTPSKENLRWHSPQPLRPIEKVTSDGIKRSEWNSEQLRIAEPGAREGDLPAVQQMQLTTAAQFMSRDIGVAKDGVQIRSSWVPKGVTPRWWPLNRIRSDCWPLYLVSDPVRNRNLAFVTVRSEHWGTLYAVQRNGSGWRVIAEWSRWLY